MSKQKQVFDYKGRLHPATQKEHLSNVTCTFPFKGGTADEEAIQSPFTMESLLHNIEPEWLKNQKDPHVDQSHLEKK